MAGWRRPAVKEAIREPTGKKKAPPREGEGLEGLELSKPAQNLMRVPIMRTVSSVSMPAVASSAA